MTTVAHPPVNLMEGRCPAGSRNARLAARKTLRDHSSVQAESGSERPERSRYQDGFNQTKEAADTAPHAGRQQ